MTEEMIMTIKEIFDKAGLDTSIEQIEAGMAAMAEDEPEEDPWLDEVIGKIEAERKDTNRSEEKGLSMKGGGQYRVASGRVELEYRGRAHKKYQGDAVLLIKPDDSLVVHGLRGVKPVSYLAMASDIHFRGKDGKLTITAEAGGDSLTITFLRMSMYESLFKEITQETARPSVKKPAADIIDLTEEEKTLEARLKKLRIDLAHRESISFLPAVFDNKTMYQLIRHRPKTLEELKLIKGFGTRRIERYAASVLETINGHAG